MQPLDETTFFARIEGSFGRDKKVYQALDRKKSYSNAVSIKLEQLDITITGINRIL